MGVIGKDFKYKLVKGFFSKETTKLLCGYSKIRHTLERSLDPILQGQTDLMETMYYGDPATETTMMMSKKNMEEITGKKLLPTYTFWRMYTQFSELKKHKDRPSCEISVTINLGSDGTKWPIYMDGTPVELEPGDGVVYLGCELEHYREEFQGDWCSQVFMHYVDAEGPYKEFYLDKRFCLGAPFC